MRVGQLSAIDFLSKVVSSFFGFIATVYFARTLGADTLGTYYLILSVVGWISLFGSMGVGGSLIKRISEGTDRGKYLSAGATIMSGFFILLSVVLFVFRGTLDTYIGVPAFGFVIVLLCVGLAGSFVDAVLQGQRLVHVYSLLKPVRRAIRTAVQIGAVVVGFELTGLVVGYAFGGVVAVLLGLFFISVNIALPRRKHFKSLVDYAKFSWLGKLKSKTFNRADILILGVFVTPSLVGVYSIAWNIAGFLSIFSSSIISALFPEVSNISAQADPKESVDLVEKGLAYAGLITLPGLAGGIILGENILTIYGQEFVQGSFILILLISASVVYDYQKVIVSVLGAIDRPDLAFRVNGVLIVTNIVLNVMLIYFFDWVGAAVATLMSAIISFTLGYSVLNRLVSVEFPLYHVSRQVTSALVMSIVVIVAERILQGYNIVTMRTLPTVGLVLLGAAIYTLSLLIVSPPFRRTVSDNIRPLVARL